MRGNSVISSSSRVSETAPVRRFRRQRHRRAPSSWAAIAGTTREPRLRRLAPDGTPLWSTMVVGAGKGSSQARCVREAPDGTVVAVGGQDEGTDGRDAWVARFTP